MLKFASRTENAGDLPRPAVKPIILLAGNASCTRAVAEAMGAISDHCVVARGLNDSHQKALKYAPAACLVDMTLWKSGWKLVEKLRGNNALSNTPIFVLSTQPMQKADRLLAKHHKVEKWIVKPFNSTTIRYQVANAILASALKKAPRIKF